MRRSRPLLPPAEYEVLRTERPVSKALLPTGRWSWLIANYEYARSILSDPRVSSDRTHPNFPALVPNFGAVAKAARGFLAWMDPPDHTLYRRMMTAEFTLRRIRGLRPYVQSVVDECIDRLLSGDRPADLVATLSLPVPSLVICELLGVPYADRASFQAHTHVMASHRSTSEDRLTAMRELRSYLLDLVTTKRTRPGDDLLSRLIARYAEAGVTDHDHLAGMAVFMLIAGHETTANMISLGAVALATNPEQLARFVAEPDLAPRAVDELLRYMSNLDHVARRVAVDDIEIGGETIREGEGVIVLNAAANHDDAVFECPHRLDIGRDSRSHLAFSYGMHQCLGQNLARLELEVALTTLFRRCPGLRPTMPIERLPFKDDTSMYGLHEVQVTW